MTGRMRIGCEVRPFQETSMENVGIGWIATIIIGEVAGWLAEQFMKSDMGMLISCSASSGRRLPAPF